MVESNPTAAANNERLLQIAHYDAETLDLYRRYLGATVELLLARVRINRFIDTLESMQIDCAVCNNEDQSSW